LKRKRLLRYVGISKINTDILHFQFGNVIGAIWARETYYISLLVGDDVKQDVFDQAWCLPLLKWYDSDNPVHNMVKVVSFEKPLTRSTISTDDLETSKLDEPAVLSVVDK